MTYESRPPSGIILRPNQRTRLLRPALPISPERAERIRAVRRRHPDLSVEEVAAMVAENLETVRQALAVLRTRAPAPSWRVLNVSPEAHAFVRRHALPGEPAWATVNRILAAVARLPRGDA